MVAQFTVRIVGETLSRITLFAEKPPFMNSSTLPPELTFPIQQTKKMIPTSQDSDIDKTHDIYAMCLAQLLALIHQSVLMQLYLNPLHPSLPPPHSSSCLVKQLYLKESLSFISPKQGWFSPGQVFVLDEYCARNGVRGCHRHLCYLRDLLERAENGAMIDPTLLHYSFAFCASHVHGNR